MSALNQCSALHSNGLCQGSHDSYCLKGNLFQHAQLATVSYRGNNRETLTRSIYWMKLHKVHPIMSKWLLERGFKWESWGSYRFSSHLLPGHFIGFVVSRGSGTSLALTSRQQQMTFYRLVVNATGGSAEQVSILSWEILKGWNGYWYHSVPLGLLGIEMLRLCRFHEVLWSSEDRYVFL